MNRPELQVYEESLSSSLAEDIDLSQKLMSKLDLAQEALPKSLSLRSVISTTSSFATRQQAAADSGVDQDLLAIGAGTCGTVFKIPGTRDAVKRAKDGYEQQLWNDCVSQKSVCEAFAKHQTLLGDLRVPDVVSFVTTDDEEFWKEHRQRFPETHRTTSALYFTRRITPLPKVIRHALIDKYFPDGLKVKAKEDMANKNCLVRLYLGKRRDPTRQKPARATLIDYNLHLDQMEELLLDTSTFAVTMARALAIIHWEAGLDAEDVEFVLGSSPTTAYAPTSLQPKSCKLLIPVKSANEEEGAILRQNALDLAISAFYKNDPYYPRPLSANIREEKLWRVFREAYLSASKAVLQNEPNMAIKELPALFIQGLMAEGGSETAEEGGSHEKIGREGGLVGIMLEFGALLWAS